MFFSLRPGRAVINDVNRELVNLYETARDDPEALISAICRRDDGMSEKGEAATDAGKGGGCRCGDPAHLFLPFPGSPLDGTAEAF